MLASTPHPEPALAPLISNTFHRKLIFIHGKGGVGKTTLSHAIAQGLASQNHRTLWVTLQDPTQAAGKCVEVKPNLFHLNCDFFQAFEEYAALKIKIHRLTQLFISNKLMRYLAQAAPGVRELVLLGKIWFEQTHFEHVVVDLPSTGYGIALFQSAENFSKLFRSGPLHQDTIDMLRSFHDPSLTGHAIVALPEETPLQESIELKQHLIRLFPNNAPIFLVNRLFPKPDALAFKNSLENSLENPLKNFENLGPPSEWPIHCQTFEDYAHKRFALETHNLLFWQKAGIQYGELPYLSPILAPALRETLTQTLIQKAYL